MEYVKLLLQREKKAMDTVSAVMEMVGNGQEIKNVMKRLFALLDSVKGDVSIIRYKEEKFEMLHYRGDKASIEIALEDKALLKKVNQSIEPYLEGKHKGYYHILPIHIKEDVLGFLVFHEEEMMVEWKDVATFLYTASITLKHYEVVERLKLLGTEDSTTGLNNLRHFQEQLELLTDISTRHELPMNVVSIKLVDYKSIIDKLGYEAGEEAMKAIAGLVKKTVRKTDMPVRYDKNTVAILLMHTDHQGAGIMLLRFLQKMKRHEFTFGDFTFKLRIEVAVTTYEHGSSIETYLETSQKDYLNIEVFEEDYKKRYPEPHPNSKNITR